LPIRPLAIPDSPQHQRRRVATRWGLLLALLASAAQARELPQLLRLDRLELQQIAARSFTLAGEQRLEVVGTAFQKSATYGEITRAWILEAKTRKVVWDLGNARLIGRGRETRQFADEVRLPAGDYEVYFSTFPASAWRLDHDLDWFDMVGVRGPDFEDYRRAAGDLALVLRGVGRPGPDPRGAAVTPGTVLALAGKASGKQAQGFVLPRTTRIELYAVGELAEDGRFDYGWISDSATGKKVWIMSWEDSEPAGGARKNRRVQRSLELPAGRYVATYVADDSHGPGDWNAAPPYDPLSWGLTVRAAEASQAAGIATFAVEEPKAGEVVAAITQPGDSECRQIGFTLRRPLRVRVHAIGEGSEGEMYDYGWLVDARTRQKVWSMPYAQTEPAGGARKNRMSEAVLELPAGSYFLHWVSDGSHSYVDWNAAAPADRERWGVTLYALSEGFDRRTWLAPYAEDETAGQLLADLAKLGSDAHRRVRFQLDAKRRIRVEALGEASGGRMVDYGWIEDASGKVVWELTARMTDAAGGAAKNRRFDGLIELPAGSYLAHFVTDGSHAFGDFNDDPPRNPTGWGMRLYLVSP
jgi:hypothetical protein